MTAPGFGVTVTFITRGTPTKDAYGSDQYLNQTSVAVPGCVVAPGDANGAGGNELTNGQDLVLTGMVLYAPTGTVVTAVDAVTVPEYGTFEVEGTPAVWPPHPFTGWQPPNSVVLRLQKVTG